jgi:hypothetical protein
VKRQAAMASRDAIGGYLADPAWMERVLERTCRGIHELGDWGYPFPLDDSGSPRRNSLQGPEYMRHNAQGIEQSISESFESAV